MNVEFEIKELEALVEPENLIDLLDDLLQEGKLDSYHYDWENGRVLLEVSEHAVISEMFKEQIKGKLNS